MHALLLRQATKLLGQVDVPGLSLALVEDGEVTLEAGLGLADVASRRPVGTRTTFQAASIAKTLTAWAVMRLVEHDRIGLDDPILAHVSRFRLPLSAYDEASVTIRRVMSHTGGLSLADYPGIDPDQPHPGTGAALFGEGHDPLRLIAAPATGFRYSGGGWTLLQLLIEEVTGVAFAAHMWQTVLAPLGMTSSSFSASETAAHRLASPYGERGDRLPVYRHDAEAAAGLISTAGDLARFLTAHLEGPDGQPGRGVITPAGLTLLTTPQAETGRTDGLWSGYGLGYEIETLADGRRVVGHAGLNRGWRARIACLPERGAGIALLCNADRGMSVVTPLVARWLQGVAGAAAFDGPIMGASP